MLGDMLGDIYVSPFRPPLLAFVESSMIFWGHFFISFNRCPINFEA